MSQGDEHTLLEYARIHGLACNHLTRDPLKGLKAPDDYLQGLEIESDDLYDGDLKDYQLDEKLSFGKEAILLLASVTTPISSDYPPRFDVDVYNDPHPSRNFKCELPMLQTDHDLDKKEFAVPFVPHLEHEFLPLEKIDDEADEGLKWPLRNSTLLEELAEKSRSEKLQVSTETLTYLRDALISNDVDGKLEWQDGQARPYKRNTAADPVTPPLLPLTPPLQPFIPPSDAGNLELLSDQLSPTHQEIYDADRMLFEKDAIKASAKIFSEEPKDSDPMLLDIATVGKFYSPLKDIQDPPSSPQINRTSSLDRKIEGPLTPLALEQSPPWMTERVSLDDSLRKLIPELPLPAADLEEISSDDIDKIFAESIGPLARKAERGIEQEQLSEADTTCRVSVPIMDFSLPQPPWRKASCKDEIRNRLGILKKTHLTKSIWPIDGKSERDLSWVPFPASFGQTDLHDKILDENLESKYLVQPERFDTSTLTWKPDGLRILDEVNDSENEDLKYGSFRESRDLNYLVRKRKFELEDESETHPRSTEMNSKFTEGNPLIDPIQGTKESEQIPRVNTKKSHDDIILVSKDQASNPFSAVGALDEFMCIRKGETQNHEQTARLPCPVKDKNFTPRSIEQDNQYKAQEQSKSLVKPISLPLPQTVIPHGYHPFVVSTLFLRSRKLARRVQTLYPAAEFIERNFAAYSYRRGTPGRDTKLPLPDRSTLDSNAMADDADIIVSPSTGLILTSVQKIKQRPLPGQTARSRVHERILQAAPRYERLLVMISEDSNTEHAGGMENGTSNGLTDSDWDAVADFMGFCSSLQDETQGHFIAGGQEQLAQWIVAMMVKYGVADPQIRLLQDETAWEVFLRRAGMNAFAAQCILTQLKASQQSIQGLQNCLDFGLAAFIKMPLEEKLTRFEGLFGGRSLLIRVSNCLDARW